MSIHVRLAADSDLEFILHCNQKMAAETEDKGLDVNVLRRGIAYGLAHPNESLYLVAALNGELAGTLMLTFEWSDWRNGRFWWIQSVYVRPEYRRAGVYRALHAAARQRALTDSQSCGLRLYVERENHGAQKTYRALGMAELEYDLYEEGFSRD